MKRTSNSFARLAMLPLVLAAASCGAAQERAVVERYYAARIAGDLETAARERARDAAKDLPGSDPALVAYEILDVDVWAEHGATCRVREHFTDGRVEEVSVQLVRERGDWKVGTMGREPSSPK